MNYTTDEEKVEAIKQWWRDNGTAVVLGLVVAIGSVVGFKTWQGMQESQAEQASVLYTELMETMDEPDDARQLANKLMGEYDGTPYAELAALALARLEMGTGNADAARVQLESVMQSASQPEIKHVARLRLARVLNELGQPDEALGTLDAQGFPEAFAPMADELRGDIHQARGELALARKAYERALAAGVMEGRDPRLLRMKRDNLPSQGDQDDA